MDKTVQVEKFLRDIRRRNRREIILGILGIPFLIGMMLILGLLGDAAPVGSLMFFGLLLIILSILFNIGMTWFVASPRGDLSSRPASNVDHWATEMLRQAKLLRLSPLWGSGLTHWTPSGIFWRKRLVASAKARRAASEIHTAIKARMDGEKSFA